MPTYTFVCETCGAERREWRPEGHPPRFCSRECMSRGLAGQSRKPVKYRITPAMHDAIRQVYTESSGNGEVQDLARRLGLPRWKISRYAVRHGWTATVPKEPEWSDEELSILERNAHLCPDRIRIKLRAAGFSRTPTAIVLKRKRMRFSANLAGQSAHGLAECLGVDAKTVTRWIDAGWLKARRRGTARTERQGGDMWFIKDRWVKDFIRDNVAQIDLRKVDKHWFVDVLSN